MGAFALTSPLSSVNRALVLLLPFLPPVFICMGVAKEEVVRDGCVVVCLVVPGLADFHMSS